VIRGWKIVNSIRALKGPQKSSFRGIREKFQKIVLDLLRSNFDRHVNIYSPNTFFRNTMADIKNLYTKKVPSFVNVNQYSISHFDSFRNMVFLELNVECVSLWIKSNFHFKIPPYML